MGRTVSAVSTACGGWDGAGGDAPPRCTRKSESVNLAGSPAGLGEPVLPLAARSLATSRLANTTVPHFTRILEPGANSHADQGIVCGSGNPLVRPARKGIREGHREVHAMQAFGKVSHGRGQPSEYVLRGAFTADHEIIDVLSDLDGRMPNM